MGRNQSFNNRTNLIVRLALILPIVAVAGAAGGGLPNDNCPSAQVVTDGAPAAEGDNSAAGAADDAEAGCSASDNDVWFQYVATCTGTAGVDTFGSGQDDTVLSVYDACGGNEIVCDDDTAGTLSQVFFAVASGQSYWIRLASIGLPGDFDLNISCNGTPANDNCASATVVTDGVPAAEGDNSGAGAIDDAEAACATSDKDVWFEYVATCTGSVAVDTFSSGQDDTVLSVYDACSGSEITCNDDTVGLLSQVTIATTAGQSYWIRLASIGAPGDYDLNISCSGTPSNDNCALATVVTDGVPAAEGDNSGAGATDDAEAGCSASDKDVWFEYVATCTGDVTVDTFGSGQADTVLSIHDACGGSEIACNDDTSGTLSEVSFTAMSGVSYWIRLASIGLPGDYDLNISCSDVPPNDNCATATIVTDGAPAAEGDNSGAGATDDAEAGCTASDRDVWFEYVATCTGAVTVNTFGSGQEDTVLSIYDACGGSEIACNDDATGTLSELLFAAISGQSYWIRLASIGLPGDYDLSILCSGTPGNDNCATATVVNEGVPAAEGENSGAGATDDAEATCAASDGDVWFEYVATCTADVTVDTFGSGQDDTVLSVYDACGGSEIACNDDTNGTLSEVLFAATSGRSYWIRIASIGAAGDYDLNVFCVATPSSPIGAAFPHDILKNRYISIDPRGADALNIGRNLDIRVTLRSTLVSGVTAVGSQWWANAPDADCIAIVGPTRPTAPPNWDACPTLHLTGCPIIPTSSYDIVMIDDDIGSEPFVGAATQAKPGPKWHGDCVGFFDGAVWTPPNGVTSVDDAVAAIKTFQDINAFNATHVSVTDMVPNLTPGPQINLIININDVFSIILGFQGQEYPGPEIELCPD